MKKHLVSFVFLVVFGGYVAFQYLNNSAPSYAATAPLQTVPAVQTQAQFQAQTPTQQPTMVSAGGGENENSSDGGSDDASENPQPAQTQTPPPPSTQTPVPVQTVPPTPVQTPVAKPKGQYTDGSYTGSVENAYYGNVQVQATISGGKLADVTFLQYPNDRSTSRYINGQAIPILQQEAIQAQSANVNGVSGASDTSAAFQQSLAFALAQAKS